MYFLRFPCKEKKRQNDVTPSKTTLHRCKNDVIPSNIKDDGKDDITKRRQLASCNSAK